MTGAESTHELAVDSIYTALLQLMEKKPYNEITITDITRRAGVSRMAYYRNYETKDDILLKRLDKVIDDFIIQNIQIETYTSKADTFISFFNIFQQDPILQTVVKAGLIDRLIDSHKRLMTVIYTELLHIDLSKPENEIQLYAEMGSTVGLILYYADHNFCVDKRELLSIVRLFFPHVSLDSTAESD